MQLVQRVSKQYYLFDHIWIEPKDRVFGEENRAFRGVEHEDEGQTSSEYRVI